MTFYFLGQTVGAHSPALLRYGGSYFAFAVTGLAAMGPMHAALMELSRRVREAQVSGTLEAILATPLGAARAIVFSALWPLCSSVVRMGALMAFGVLLFGMPLSVAAVGPALVAMALALLAFLSLGILSAAFTIRFKKGDPIAYMLDTVSVLLGGVFYPVDVLPPPLRAAAAFLPVTHALEALRLSLLDGAGFAAIERPLLRLALFSLAVLPVSLWTFRLAVRRAKDEGSLTHF